ncbi:hypothetical protein [Microcoleus sp. Pol12B5]|uniref:hypothetical protein n=1 Tax=Microcoleus sp. Pol12B5 TaxID=3055396 RepID=UPI002FD4623D
MGYAADTLLHYIKTLWEQTDLHWNSDNQAEVESIVESIESTIESQIKQKLQSTSTSQAEQAKQEVKDSQEAVAMFAEHQKRQLRLSVATPILTALIQADAMAYTTAMSIAANDHDVLTSVQEVLDNRNTQTQIISEALSYADLLLNEVYGQQ